MERIDIRGNGANVLVLNAAEVRGLSDTSDTLVVHADADDRLFAGTGWMVDGLRLEAGELFSVFTQAGVTLLVSNLLVGDLDGDQFVDRSDAAMFSRHFGTANGADRTSGDMNGDRRVDNIDLALLQQNLGRRGIVVFDAGGPAASPPALLPSRRARRSRPIHRASVRSRVWRHTPWTICSTRPPAYHRRPPWLPACLCERRGLLDYLVRYRTAASTFQPAMPRRRLGRCESSPVEANYPANMLPPLSIRYWASCGVNRGTWPLGLAHRRPRSPVSAAGPPLAPLSPGRRKRPDVRNVGRWGRARYLLARNVPRSPFLNRDSLPLALISRANAE